MTTFSWVEDFDNSADAIQPRVTKVNFGDGYEQRFASGINAVDRSVPVTFTQRDSAEWKAIVAFLKARAGIEAFLWTPALEDDAITVVCDGPIGTIKNKGGRATITATFRQVFEP